MNMVRYYNIGNVSYFRWKFEFIGMGMLVEKNRVLVKDHGDNI